MVGWLAELVTMVTARDCNRRRLAYLETSPDPFSIAVNRGNKSPLPQSSQGIEWARDSSERTQEANAFGTRPTF